MDTSKQSKIDMAEVHALGFPLEDPMIRPAAFECDVTTLTGKIHSHIERLSSSEELVSLAKSVTLCVVQALNDLQNKGAKPLNKITLSDSIYLSNLMALKSHPKLAHEHKDRISKLITEMERTNKLTGQYAEASELARNAIKLLG